MRPPQPWPYPRWIAHRGAGKLAPENTLAAFKLGYAHGYRMFECDAKLSADDVPFLLHDATLERTTNAQGSAGDKPWAALAPLDAGSWHSAAYAGEPLPTLQTIADYCLQNNCLLNIEIKPSPGAERHTGDVVARMAARLWRDQISPPLLSSFRIEALQAARGAAPELPCALLLDTLWEGWLQAAVALECVAIVCNHTLWNDTTVAQVRAEGLRCMAYTVNDKASVHRLLGLGIDGLITDQVSQFSPTS